MISQQNVYVFIFIIIILNMSHNSFSNNIIQWYTHEKLSICIVIMGSSRDTGNVRNRVQIIMLKRNGI